MTTESQKQRPWYFNLKADGDNAIVRLLHSTTSTIEKVVSHRAEVDGKPRRIRCVGEGCPLCDKGSPDTRIYVHLFDYTDNKEKVWERTDKILPQFEKLQTSWNPLSSAVIRITRKGNEFPKYDIEVLNPTSYADVDKSLVDQQIAKFYSMNRKAEEIQEFLNTGKFPERKPFVSKEEYYKQKNSEKENIDNTSVQTQTTTSTVDDPFMDDVIVPRKV